MAAVMAAKPVGAQPKMKKPSIPLVQTNTNGVKTGQPPSSSPSSAIKRLPGQAPTATPISATPASAHPNSARPNRRLQRLSTRGGALDSSSIDKKTAKKYPEPYGEFPASDLHLSIYLRFQVPCQSHILKKFKGKPPSLIVHLHQTHFRFDQQDGSFSYQSEMRIFIEHLRAGTIPHDMVEEFRKSEVQFYDGWLVVRVFDHRTANNSMNNSNDAGDSGKPFSIHNYNPYITPSPYAPYPTKEQTGQRSPHLKQENSASSQSKDGSSSDARSDDTVVAPKQPSKPQPKVYHVALRPTELSRHADLVFDAMAPDPKSLNRKQSQANANRGAPPTPVSGVPATPATERPPPLKKQKLKIDPKDLVEYEARIINATAPPLHLEPAKDYEDAMAIIEMLKDPMHDLPPPTAKSRKRTFAELAADDAYAKEQERFMLIMDERNAGNAPGANAGAVEAQAAAFQPRFEKFNALESIKREIEERKQREKDRQLQDDENRRGAQEKAEDERRRQMLAHQQRQRDIQAARLRQQQEMQQNAHRQAEETARRQQQQASSIPPQMQNQMIAAQQRSSPLIRQGTPQAASSPIVNNPQGGQAMAVTSSQQGAGSPQRPGSAVQHGHPGVAMARGPSAQGPSRHGTPQIPHSTPGMRNATPIMRQGTPSQHMTQASPHGSMMAPAPQMAHAAAMQGQQMPQQQQYTAQQMQQLQAQRAAMQQQAAMRGQPMVNGTQMPPAQVAQMHAQQQREAAMHRMQQQQQQQQQAMQQQGNPPTPQMAQSPAQGAQQDQYKQQLSQQMRAQMSNMQGSNQGSPAPNPTMTPQQQQAALAQQQQRMLQQQQQQQGTQQQMMTPQMAQAQQTAAQQAQQQGRPPQMSQWPPQMQQFFQTAVHSFQQRFMQQAAQKYGGNTGMLNQQELAQVNQLAQKSAMNEVSKRRAQGQAQMMQAQQQAAQRQQAAQQGGQMPNGMNMNMGQQHQNMNVQHALQQQQAQHMQQLQMHHAQQQMMAQQNQHQQQPGGGQGQGQQQAGWWGRDERGEYGGDSGLSAAVAADASATATTAVDVQRIITGVPTTGSWGRQSRR